MQYKIMGKISPCVYNGGFNWMSWVSKLILMNPYGVLYTIYFNIEVQMYIELLVYNIVCNSILNC